jgi:hypothetical protein
VSIDGTLVQSVVWGEFLDDSKAAVPEDLPCLQPSEAPATLRMFNMIWAWVLCIVRSDRPVPPGHGMDKEFLRWLRDMAGALPTGSTALAILQPHVRDTDFDFEAACRSMDGLTTLLYEPTPYMGHDDASFRELCSSYYHRFSTAAPVVPSPLLHSVDPFFMTPGSLCLFPLLAEGAMGSHVEDDLRFTRNCVRRMQEQVLALSAAKASPGSQATMAVATLADCEPCVGAVGRFVAFHVFDTVRLFLLGNETRARNAVTVSDRDPPSLNFTDPSRSYREVYFEHVVCVQLEPPLLTTLRNMLQWYCFFCAELQRWARALDAGEAGRGTQHLLSTLVSSFSRELSSLAASLAPMWPSVVVDSPVDVFYSGSGPPAEVSVPNQYVFGAAVHSVLAGIIGYDGGADKTALQNLFGARCAPTPEGAGAGLRVGGVTAGSAPAPPPPPSGSGALPSSVGFPHHGLAVDRASTESCCVSMDQQSPLFQVFVWWPPGQLEEAASSGPAANLTGTAVRQFMNSTFMSLPALVPKA